LNEVWNYLVTNEHHYEQALTVRKDDNKCVEEAIFFSRQ